MDQDSRDEALDLRGLKCPLPALFAKRALLRAPAGHIVVALTDDPMAAIDVPHMCRQERFEVVSIAREGDTSRIAMRRPESA